MLSSLLLFIWNTAFSLCCSVFIVRAWALYTPFSPYNQIYRNLCALSDRIYQPIARLIRPQSKIDWPSIICLFLCGLLHTAVRCVLIKGRFPHLSVAWPLSAALSILTELASFTTLVLFLAVIVSWVPQLRRSDVTALAYAMTAPLFRVVHRLMPPFFGIDLSPWVLMLSVHFLSAAFVTPVLWQCFSVL